MPAIRFYNAGMYRNLDLQLLRTFATTAEHGSMTVAGNVLSQTQGAISQQVKRLEDMLGSALFTRAPRGLRLTPAGERLQGHARRLLNLNDEVWADMAQAAAPGQLRLGVPYDLVASSIVPLLRSFHDSHPLVDVTLVCRASPDLLLALAAGELDLAVVEQEADAAPGPAGGGETLRLERLVWVGAHGGRAHLRQPLPVSMVAETCAFRPAVLAALEQHGRGWRTVYEHGSLDATTATVRSDLAVTAWLACTVPPDLRILGAADGLPALPPFAITLHLPRHAPAPAAQAFARHLRDGLAR